MTGQYVSDQKPRRRRSVGEAITDTFTAAYSGNATAQKIILGTLFLLTETILFKKAATPSHPNNLLLLQAIPIILLAINAHNVKEPIKAACRALARIADKGIGNQNLHQTAIEAPQPPTEPTAPAVLLPHA